MFTTIWTWIQANMLLAGGALVAIWFFFFRKKSRRFARKTYGLARSRFGRRHRR